MSEKYKIDWLSMLSDDDNEPSVKNQSVKKEPLILNVQTIPKDGQTKQIKFVNPIKRFDLMTKSISTSSSNAYNGITPITMTSETIDNRANSIDCSFIACLDEPSISRQANRYDCIPKESIPTIPLSSSTPLTTNQMKGTVQNKKDGLKMMIYYNPILKGINGQLRTKDKRLQVNEVIEFSKQIQMETMKLETMTLFEAIDEIFKWKTLNNLHNRIKQLVEEEHKISFKNEANNQMAKTLFRMAKIKENDLRKHKVTKDFGTNFIKKLKNSERKEALRLYTKALIKIKTSNEESNKIFMKSLEARARLITSPTIKLNVICMIMTITKTNNPNYALKLAQCYQAKAEKLHGRLLRKIAEEIIIGKRIPKHDSYRTIFLQLLYKAKGEICRAVEWCQGRKEEDMIIARAAKMVDSIILLENSLPWKTSPTESIEKDELSQHQSTDVYNNVNVDSGPGLVALNTIEQNKHIFYEYPVAFYTKNSLCPGCYRMINGNVWPCFTCVEVYYCSQLCQQMHSHLRMCGFNNFIHKTLGPVASLTYQLISRAATNIVLAIGESRNESWIRNMLEEIVYGNKKNPNNETIDPYGQRSSFILLNVLYGGQLYSQSTGAKINVEILSLSVTLGLLIIEHLSKTSIKEASFQNEIKTVNLDVNQMKLYIASIYKVYRCLFHLPVARFPITSRTVNKNNRQQATSNTQRPTNKIISVGYGLGSFGARIERSCDPNVFRYLSSNGRIVYRALRPIQKDEKLTINCYLWQHARTMGSIAYALPKDEYCCPIIAQQENAKRERSMQRQQRSIIRNNSSKGNQQLISIRNSQNSSKFSVRTPWTGKNTIVTDWRKNCNKQKTDKKKART